MSSQRTFNGRLSSLSFDFKQSLTFRDLTKALCCRWTTASVSMLLIVHQNTRLNVSRGPSHGFIVVLSMLLAYDNLNLIGRP